MIDYTRKGPKLKRARKAPKPLTCDMVNVCDMHGSYVFLTYDWAGQIERRRAA